ncbi:UDP-N-acetylmuramoyl-tripeptide--D-alanyl-D-alanine ligase [Nafulsella turpanensis]|uniref:UDP-N-acetylmuramoyl-tripeptide--D-alanyl-D- alanine ligase n=1 Tax=Nafulsella turpanensis TaxID=1265690 RepID=UPI00034B0C5A|nr:UDP-N-acetylmuramoyl-tripeptide--D-alanyl-D-alanine ligase [Nafulsella turpanensis]
MNQKELEALYEKYKDCKGVSTDTRNLPEGCLFVALKGPNFDANAFAEEAVRKGARYAIISDEKYQKDERFLLVEDSLNALQLLANHHRRQQNIPVIGITGSNGKTTTKELIAAVLQQKYRCWATKGNLNNHIGVPLTLLNAPADTEIMVVEMGANKLKDIQELCEIAEPTHGLITNIGKAHLEGFGGFDGVIRTKSELYQFLLEHKGTAFVNSRNELLENMGKRFQDPIYYPAKEDYYHCELITADPFVELKAENGEKITTRLMGIYNFENIAAALCIGKYFEVDTKKANEAVAGYSPSNNRSQLIEHENGNYIILDAYNANPTSMKAAIENFAALKRPKKVVILGDMKELGSDTIKEHHELGRLLARYHFDRILLCGLSIIEVMDNNPNAIHFESREMLLNYLKSKKFTDTTFLVKGSRSMGLEEVVNYL